ncbi:MAG: hypothetical protein M1828_002014 [Chrysothrix sp. TS-e1954]|nr:MAG: hypothetical protein M1828_002014 [Chrysothrix sp. TS-e1954]
MAEDYSKLTVVQIRELFKTRSIPATGLTRKQQLIDKLQEEDAKTGQPAETETNEQLVKESKAIEGVQDNDVKPPAGDAVADDPAVDVPQESVPIASVEHSEQLMETSQSVPDNPAPIVADVKTSSIQQQEESNDTTGTKSKMDLLEETVISEEKPTTSTLEATTVLDSPSSEQTRKRKRRSPSPQPADEDAAAAKRRKPHEDTEVKAEPMQVDEVTIEASHMNGAETGTVTETAQDMNLEKEDKPNGDAPDALQSNGEAGMSESQVRLGTTEETSPSQIGEPVVTPKQQVPPSRPRFQGLVERPEPESLVRDHPPPVSTSPSRHPASSALYIANLKRPLRPDALREHITSLAQPPSGEAERTVRLGTFFLDSIRSHCFVALEATTTTQSPDSVDPAVSAAARVRDYMHNALFPPGETQREPLLVDFVPASAVPTWIEAEQGSAGGRGGGGKRWEVVYQAGREDAEGDIVAVHQEASSAAPPLGPRDPSFSSIREPAGPIPLSDRAMKAEPEKTVKPEPPRSQAFLALDKLFTCTKAKPSLYYICAKDAVADQRLQMLKSNTAKDFIPNGGGPEDREPKRRFTFEPRNARDDVYDDIIEGRDREELLVDNGPEFGMFGGRGGRGGRGGGRGGSRGGRGWRQ